MHDMRERRTMRHRYWFMTIALVGLAYGESAASQAKPTCAVLTFDSRVGVSVPESQMLSDRFATEFDRLGRYTIVARSMMREILDEQEFQATDHCSAAACAVEAGQLLGVRYMVYGTIGRLGGIYSVNSFMVDVETGQQVRSATTDMDGDIGQALTWLMSANAHQLLGLEPASRVATTRPRLTSASETQVSSAIRVPQHPLPRTPRKLWEKSFFMGPRAGVSTLSGIVGAQVQYRNFALAGGWIPDGIALSAKYFFHSPGHSWFIAIGIGGYGGEDNDYADFQSLPRRWEGTWVDKQTTFFVGGLSGYRWQWKSGWDISVGAGLASAIEEERGIVVRYRPDIRSYHGEDYTSTKTFILPMIDLTLGYSL